MTPLFNLSGLLRLRRVEEDQRALELNSARDQEAIGAARSRRVRSELAASNVDPVSYASLASIAATRASTTELLSELSELEAAALEQVAVAASAHAEAHRRTLGLEKLEGRFDVARAAEENKAEQLALDDLSARAWHLSQPEDTP
jgi:flagellar biosynthesis chaperone FliJ